MANERSLLLTKKGQTIKTERSNKRVKKRLRDESRKKNEKRKTFYNNSQIARKRER